LSVRLERLAASHEGGRSQLTDALATMLASMRPAPRPAPSAKPTLSSAARGESEGKRIRVRLICGHIVMLGGSAKSWYGVAAWCSTCGRDVNVDSDLLLRGR
jgi:hypothetical protein